VLIIASMAKVAMDAAIPESRINTRPNSAAHSAAQRAANTAPAQKGNCSCISQLGRPGNRVCFIIGGMVSQAAA
jgi:hypothetical protein